jgi:hypothetical protein
MRNPYTPVFRRTLQSRIWALSPSTRCVWLWLRLIADPEGYVNADLAGVAAGANVTPDEARRAMEGFLAPDPDADPEDPHEGRVLERVRGGWLIIDYAPSVELARSESRNARNAQYARARRAREAAEREEARAYIDLEEVAANDAEPTEGHADARVAPYKSRSRSKLLSSEGEDSPLPPTVPSVSPSVEESAEAPSAPTPPPAMAPPSRDVAPQSTNEVGVLPAVIRSVPSDWSAPEELVAEAIMAGLTRESFDRRLADLRLGPIGGARGVLAHQLESYIRSFFGKWKAWEETDRAKARAAAAAPPSSRRQFIPPTPEPKPKHVNYAKAHGIDLKAVVADLAERKVFETLGEQSYFTNLERALAKERKRKSGEAA